MVNCVTPGGTTRSCSAPVYSNFSEKEHTRARQEGVHAPPSGQPMKQSAQASPTAPHAPTSVPGSQVFSLQQLSMQTRPPKQSAEQRPVAGLHASPCEQLVGVQGDASSFGASTLLSAGRSSSASGDASTIPLGTVPCCTGTSSMSVRAPHPIASASAFANADAADR